MRERYSASYKGDCCDEAHTVTGDNLEQVIATAKHLDQLGQCDNVVRESWDPDIHQWQIEEFFDSDGKAFDPDAR